jgi:hypothetical protein
VFSRAVVAALAAFVALVLVGPLGAAPTRAAGVAFSIAPRHVFPGKPATVRVTARPSSVSCGLTIRYAGGSRQRLPYVRAAGGRATWQFDVAAAAKPGRASMTATCGRAGRTTRSLVVVGNIVPRRISVLQRGWSVRPSRSRGSDVSYGAILQNEASDRAAVDVRVLVNFVDAENRLFGSASSRIPYIAAGARYALGDSLSFPDAAPIAKLEVVIQVGGWTRQARAPVTVANLRIFAQENDPTWGGSLEGELINDHPTLILERARLSAVIFDLDGNVIGGAQGSASASLPPGGRVFFKLTSGIRNIPVGKAYSAQVSVEVSYSQPGS